MKYFFKLILLILIFVSSMEAITQKKVLSPEEAFQISAKRSGDVVFINIELGKDIYIYADKLKINIIHPIKISLDNDIKKPKPIEDDDHKIYNKPIKLLIPISIIKKYVQSGKFKLEVQYQGCATSGICYQPLKSHFEFDLGGVDINGNTKGDLSEQDSIAQSLTNSSIWIVLLTFFGFGILLSLTPCIFPMIPILSSIIVSQSNENMSTKRAFILSLVYILAMSVAYTIAGVLAGLFGSNIQAVLQDPWVISVFSLIFVTLAFSMFGFYEIQMPSFIQSKLTKKSDEMQGQGILGVAIMGFLSALIVGPCVAAPLAGALIYIGQSGDALLGGSALFVMSMGMGLPLLIIGTGAGKYMPKPGAWMDSIKAVFGVIMLALAVWMLSRVFAADIIMFMWTALVISSAVYLGALERLEQDASGWKKLIKSFGVIVFIYGIMLFIGSMTNATNPLNPLEKFSTMTTSSNFKKVSKKTEFQQVVTLKELKILIAESTKPVMVDFYADWCVSCVELEHYTFSDKSVKEKLQNFTLLQIDVTKNTEEDKKLLKEFGLFGPPAIMFFKNNTELKNKRVIGYKNAKEFLEHIINI
ncbi:protein-disulfide reductase DsbD [Sulfurospirillum arcachonense]|uniref:protein-disulfide reductase DsbD n=1 Tax=Sulfurospirillum arcachonense TaxID=57666 RepID=UPI00046981AB|nr:protein-disulfide reductase DsbD [Sulfurospirillum arcachonense]